MIEMTENMNTMNRTRENWLNDAVTVFTPKFEDMGFKLPALRVSVGYGPSGARFENSVILGVTLNNTVVEDGAFEIWISPEIQEQSRALDVLIHELAHCAAGFEAGHKGDFEIIARMFGLEGPLTATTAGEGLKTELDLLTIELGTYPGSFVDFSKVEAQTPVPAGGSTGTELPPIAAGFPRISTGPRKQGTRLLRVECSNTECPAYGYTVRTSAKWLTIGAPKCPMGHDMT
jgi:hypothetical protein